MAGPEEVTPVYCPLCLKSCGVCYGAGAIDCPACGPSHTLKCPTCSACPLCLGKRLVSHDDLVAWRESGGQR